MLNGIKQFWRWIGVGKDEIPQKRSAVDDSDDENEAPKKRRRVSPEKQFRIVDSEEFISPLSTWTYSAPLGPHILQKMRKSSSAQDSIFVSNKENAMGVSSSAPNIKTSRSKDRGKTIIDVEGDDEENTRGASTSAPNIKGSRSKAGVKSVVDVEDDDEVVEVIQLRDPQRPALGESQWTAAIPKFRAALRPQKVNYDDIEGEVQCLDLPSSSQFGTGGMKFISDPYCSCSPPVPLNTLSTRTVKMPRNVFRSQLTMTDQLSHLSNQSSRSTNQSSRAIDAVNRLHEKSQFQELISKHRFKLGRIFAMPRSRTSSHEGILKKVLKTVKDGPPVITIDNDAPELEVIDLVNNVVKPTTLASKLADQGLKLISKPPARKASIEEIILSSSFYSRKTLVEDTRAKYDQRQREKEEQLKETQMLADGFKKQTGDTLKVIEERLRRQLSLTEVVLEEEVVEITPQLPELTPEIQNKIKSALACNQFTKNDVLVEKFSLSITRHDMSSLAKLNWLNDEVINFYMNLLIERGKRKEFPNVYAFNTFFYPKLLQGGHAGLKRWTRKIDVFAHDLIVVPVHLGVHWCLAVIDFRDKHVRYYDSMGSANNKCLQELLRYLQAESLDKRKCAYSVEDWKLVNMQSIPQQMNGSDCGMFSCMFAEYVCRNVPITFTQDDMPYFRQKMVYEILTGSLMEFQ